MAHAHRPRRNKIPRMLVEQGKVIQFPTLSRISDRDNIVQHITHDDKREINNIIKARYDSAKEQTSKIAAEMELQEKLYMSEWEDPDADNEDRVFLPKTKEQVLAVYSYIMFLVSQLNPLIVATPRFRTLWNVDEEYKKAKLAEGLLNYYFTEVWNIRDEVFPGWLKTFLKFSMAIWKITYIEGRNYEPDLEISVVDRALMYLDPQCGNNIKNSKWSIEKYFLPRSEVVERIKLGHWHFPESRWHELNSINGVNTSYGSASNYDNRIINEDLSEAALKRFLGENYGRDFTIPEDDLVECVDYFQAGRRGVDDLYAVYLGGIDGELVRYGRNPMAHKKTIPYRAKSYDPHEYRADGTGLVDHYKPFQQTINQFLNMRINDVQQNIISPVVMTGPFFNKQTQEDMKNGNKIVRLDESVLEAAQDPNFDLRKHIYELPIRTSTRELFDDLGFLLNQGKEASNVSDIFRGQSISKRQTLGEVNEQLSRNQGQFRPIYLQVMHGLTELGEIGMDYFKNPDFFSEERIIQIVGDNRYERVIQGWHKPQGSKVSAIGVTHDAMDVDISLDIISGADAAASRSFLMSSIQQVFQAVGQIPELYEEAKKKLNFSKIIEMMLESSGTDIEAIRLNEEEIAALEKQAEEAFRKQQEAVRQQQQDQIELQGQLESLKAEVDKDKEAFKQQLIAAQNQRTWEYEKGQSNLDHEHLIRQIVSKVSNELRADLIKMREEAKLERANAGISVGHGNEISSSKLN